MNIIDAIKKLENLYFMTGASQKNIEDAEDKLGLKFANEYKIYISEYGAISAKGIELTGATKYKRLNVVDATMQERNLNSNFPKDMYVIENIGIDGILMLQDTKGYIYELHPYSKPTKQYDSLADYLLSKI